MKLEFLLCAELASVDKSTNRLSIFNIMDELSTPSFPSLVPQLAVVSTFTRKKKKKKSKIVH